MIRVIAAGLWGVIVTIAANFGAETYLLQQAGSHAAASPKIETLTTGPMRIPIMAGEKAAGYVLLDLAVDYEAAAVAPVQSKLPGIAVDEAFRVVYETTAVDFRKARKTDLTALLQTIATRLDARIARGSIKEVRVKEFMFAPARKAAS